MRMRNYCVTVMDNWTPMRYFFTRKGAIQWRDKTGSYANAYRWHSNIGKWIEMSRSPLIHGECLQEGKK